MQDLLSAGGWRLLFIEVFSVTKGHFGHIVSPICLRQVKPGGYRLVLDVGVLYLYFIMGDNTTTLCKWDGRTCIAGMSSVCLVIWYWCLSNDIWIFCAYIPGQNNVSTVIVFYIFFLMPAMKGNLIQSFFSEAV